MQVVIEDYIHAGCRSAPHPQLFFTCAVGLIAIFAILKLAFGG